MNHPMTKAPTRPSGLRRALAVLCVWALTTTAWVLSLPVKPAYWLTEHTLFVVGIVALTTGTLVGVWWFLSALVRMSDASAIWVAAGPEMGMAAVIGSWKAPAGAALDFGWIATQAVLAIIAGVAIAVVAVLVAPFSGARPKPWLGLVLAFAPTVVIAVVWSAKLGIASALFAGISLGSSFLTCALVGNRHTPWIAAASAWTSMTWALASWQFHATSQSDAWPIITWPFLTILVSVVGMPVVLLMARRAQRSPSGESP